MPGGFFYLKCLLFPYIQIALKNANENQTNGISKPFDRKRKGLISRDMTSYAHCGFFIETRLYRPPMLRTDNDS